MAVSAKYLFPPGLVALGLLSGKTIVVVRRLPVEVPATKSKSSEREYCGSSLTGTQYASLAY
jgi:hypothetical protein